MTSIANNEFSIGFYGMIQILHLSCIFEENRDFQNLHTRPIELIGFRLEK